MPEEGTEPLGNQLMKENGAIQLDFEETILYLKVSWRQISVPQFVIVGGFSSLVQ